jgi:hypothetical protein
MDVVTIETAVAVAIEQPQTQSVNPVLCISHALYINLRFLWPVTRKAWQQAGKAATLRRCVAGGGPSSSELLLVVSDL